MNKFDVRGVRLAKRLLPLLFAICIFAGQSAKSVEEKSDHKQNADIRKLYFPADKSIGALILSSRESNFHTWPVYTHGNQIAGAKGKLTLEIPPGKLLMLDLNRRVFEHPALLNEMSPSGIDILRLSFISLDDREDGMLNDAIPHVNVLKGLKALYFDRSEAGDAQLEKIKDLPHLCALNCFLTSIRGECFKSFADLPELYELDVPHCQLDGKNLVYLSRIRKLSILDLGLTGLSTEDIKHLSKCTGLTRLSLSGNSKLTDACMSYLAPLTKLRYLDLRDTRISIEGLKALKETKLTVLALPASLRSKTEEVQSIFPKTGLSFDGGRTPMSSADKVLYSPLH